MFEQTWVLQQLSVRTENLRLRPLTEFAAKRIERLVGLKQGALQLRLFKLLTGARFWVVQGLLGDLHHLPKHRTG